MSCTFRKGKSEKSMVANNIDSMNIPENYVREAEVDGIEILVNLVKQHKIDPWNVDIVDVT